MASSVHHNIQRGKRKTNKCQTKEINSENNIRVVDIQPAKTKTNFIANAGQIPDYTNNTLDPEYVADAVIYAISAPHITQISLKNDFMY